MAIGISFSPGQSDQQQQQGTGGSPSGAPPLQQALQLLSLRLPRVLGANALAPSALLNASGASGLAGPRDVSLEQWLARLFGHGGFVSNGWAGSGGLASHSPTGTPFDIPPPSAPLPRISAGQLDPGAPPGSGGGPRANVPLIPIPGGSPRFAVPRNPPGVGSAASFVDRSNGTGDSSRDVYQPGPWGLRANPY